MFSQIRQKHLTFLSQCNYLYLSLTILPGRHSLVLEKKKKKIEHRGNTNNTTENCTTSQVQIELALCPFIYFFFTAGFLYQ